MEQTSSKSLRDLCISAVKTGNLKELESLKTQLSVIEQKEINDYKPDEKRVNDEFLRCLSNNRQTTLDEIRRLLEEIELRSLKKEIKSFREKLLRQALQSEHLEIIKYLLTNNICSLDNYEYTHPIIISAKSGNINIVDYLLDTMTPEKREEFYKKHKEELIYDACLSGNLKLVKSILGRCDISPLVKIDDKSLLYAACESENLELIIYLITKGLKPLEGIRTYYRFDTPFDMAIRKGKFEIVKYFSEDCHIDLDEEYKYYSFFDCCYKSKNPQILRYFFPNGKNLAKKSLKEGTIQAVQSNNLELLKYFIEDCKVDANTIGDKKYSLLHFACGMAKDNLEIVKYLVSKQANINAENKYKSHPIHIAVSCNNINIAKFLIEECNVNIADSYPNGTTLLHIACMLKNKYQPNLVQYLISKGADINAVKEQYCTPLMTAIEHKSEKAVQVLLSYKANYFAKNSEGKNVIKNITKIIKSNTLLHLAVLNNDKILAISVLANKPKLITKKNKYGKTPIDLALEDRHEMLKFFVNLSGCHKVIDVFIEEALTAPDCAICLTPMDQNDSNLKKLNVII